MNSYNENLRSTVVTTLQSQYLDQKNLKSQVNAAMFTLYHAEGATITAEEKLETAQHDMKFKEKVKKQAVNNSNISNNLLASASQGDLYLKQSITNTAVCAANVQVAANAIVKLASDIGSIFGIVHAADFMTDTYTHTKNVRHLMNDTANCAELASQFAMESSMLTSQVSSATVLDKSKATNGLMNNLLKVASAEFDATSQVVAAGNATLALASSTEKLAEGALEDISVDYTAARSAYNSINKGLNLNLTVPLKTVNNTSFVVQGKAIASAFNEINTFEITNEPPYPVHEYYTILVKDSKKLTFSISNAENLLLQKKYKSIIKIPIPGTSEIHPQEPFPATFNFFAMPGPSEDPIFTLKDSDEEYIKYGQKYVIFLMAVYMDAYKREINNFDDFLSAPSKPFPITIKLLPVESETIHVNFIDDPQDPNELLNEHRFKQAQIQIADEGINNSDKTESSNDFDYVQRIKFRIPENTNKENEQEYRCIFLPVSGDLTSGLLTTASLRSLLVDEVNEAQKISDKMDPEIVALQSQLAAMLANGQSQRELHAQIASLEKLLLSSITDAETMELTNELAIAKGKLNEIEDLLTILNNKITERNNLISALGVTDNDQPGVFFNVTLAEQVSAGNYSKAVPYASYPPKPKSGSKTSEIATEQEIKVSENEFIAYIGPETTDNFGNPLIKYKEYMTVILTVSSYAVDSPENYTNVISDITTKASFAYDVDTEQIEK